METITPEKLKEGCHAFQQKERRDAMYKTDTFLVQHFWGKPAEVAEGLGVLLCIWNHAFYRNGPLHNLRGARVQANKLSQFAWRFGWRHLRICLAFCLACLGGIACMHANQFGFIRRDELKGVPYPMIL